MADMAPAMAADQPEPMADVIEARGDAQPVPAAPISPAVQASAEQAPATPAPTEPTLTAPTSMTPASTAPASTAPAPTVPAPPTPSEPMVQTRPATPEASKTSSAPTRPFSWMDPHPFFVILFVGNEEKPFGIQKDFLCARSRYFRDYFSKNDEPNGTEPGANGTARDAEGVVESVVRLSDVDAEAFSYIQNFLYTGSIVPDSHGSVNGSINGGGSANGTDKDDFGIPGYELLVTIWKLGDRLGIDGLCDRALEAMSEMKRLTGSIPSTEVIVQVWKETPEGSSIRRLLLSWAAEYLRFGGGHNRSGFAKALPQELLSELVVAMSISDTESLGAHSFSNEAGSATGGAVDTASIANGYTSNKHHIDHDDYDGTHSVNDNGSIHYRGASPAPKRARHFDSYPAGRSVSAMNPSTPRIAASPANDMAGSTGRKPPRTALPAASASRPGPKKRATADLSSFTAEQQLAFCSDLLTRMLSGPGFWTRLVGPFKDPVDPVRDGIPDYFDIVKRPMDLSIIKSNLENNRYKAPEEFLADMRQIFTNVYMYWKKGDTIWGGCERLEKAFEQGYGQMLKWLNRSEEPVDG